MNKEDIKVEGRYYHEMFGWCKVTHPPNEEKALVDLEADEIEYYKMGMGYVSYKRDKESRRHVLYTPISDLHENKDFEKGDSFALRQTAMKVKLTFWDKKEND